MTPEEIKHWTQVIDGLTHEMLVRYLRFLPPGHPIFVTDELVKHFNQRLDSFGGITSMLSKTVGWDKSIT